MEITWLGHAAVRVRSGQTSLIMDPFSDEVGLRVPPQLAQANVVTVSGDDANVSAVDSIGGETKPIIIKGPGEYEASGFRIKGIRTPRFAPEGETAWNTIYVIELEGMVLANLGDPSRLLNGREIEELASPSVLIMAAGSKTGYSPADAVEMVNSISPRILIPVMYAHPGNRTDLRELAPLVSELGAKPGEPVNRANVTRSNLPDETVVTLLAPAATLL